MTKMKRTPFALLVMAMLAAMLGSVLAQQESINTRPGLGTLEKPTEMVMRRGASPTMDLRRLPQLPPDKRERPEREDPDIERTEISRGTNLQPEAVTPSVAVLNAPAPSPLMNFDGLDFASWGAGHPPDTNGDVGPTYYIQTINTSIGIFRKSDGVRVAAFTFNTFMSQGNFGDVRDTGNFGDPVVLYDTFEDRWVISDFAFTLDGSNNVVNPPGSFQVIAVSKTGDPVMGGWNFYSINTVGGLGDYPKFGIWPDGLYMSVNMFGYPAGAAFQNARVYAFNKAQMYAGNPTVQVVNFNAPAADFTILPSNARLQTGTPPPGTPNYFVSTWQFLNALTVYKFHVDWDHISLSTFTGPDVPLASTSWPNAAVPNAPSLGGNSLDVLQIRAMVQNQYANIGGAESLWTTHTVRRGNTTGFAAPRWYQVNVTGGTVNANLPQAATWDPDGANVIYRFMPSLAVDRAGDMALGYTTSSSTTKPAIAYAGRLASDPVNTLSQTETLLIQGTGTQTGNCGGSACMRWGDYSSMTLDPNGCTFWYTSMYYAVDGLNHQTRIGSFGFPSCVSVGTGGTISGTVTATTGGAPLSGATVALGSRTTTTDPSGFYSFASIPAGTYPIIIASDPGFTSVTFNSIVVNDSTTTTRDFSLGTAASSACLTDTTQLDFQGGVPTSVDLLTTPGDVTLLNAPTIDQQNTAGTTTGTSFSATSLGGQTFIPAVTGTLAKVDVQLFCSGCTGTTPNLTVSIRNTSAGLPTGADLVTSTIPGFSSGAGTFYTASFGSPPALTSGTQYALILRPVSNPSVGGYFWIRSSPSTYANGQRVTTGDSGATWAADSTRDFNFRNYMLTGYPASGNQVSSTKDSNPATGFTPIWSTLSWTVNAPANTTLSFQAAASNSASGPFNFVGPDATAATFFTTSGASLSQFSGNRYLKYKAYLSTTDATMTPTLNDVTVCYADVDCSTATAPITPTPAQVCPNSTGNTASGPAGATAYSWSITNGTITSGATSQTVTYSAGSSGNVDLMLSLTAANGCPVSNSTSVPMLSIPTPTVTPGGPTTFCVGGSVTLTSNSATGNQWFLNGNPIGGATNQSYAATAAGDYTVTVTTSGCASAMSAITTVTVNPIPATPTITPGGPTTFCTGGSVTLTSSSATGNQWLLNGNPIGGATNQNYSATASGNYTVTVTASSCTSVASAATTVTVNSLPATPTISAGGATTFCPAGSVTLNSSSATGNQWLLNGNPIGGATNQSYIATAAGNYTVTVTASGCTSAASAATTVTISDTTPPTITCPANQIVSSAGSTSVSYPTPTVSDNCSGVGTPTCAPPSGSVFPLGTTTVSCSVNDASTNTASCSFTVTLVPCTISCPANITMANAANQCGAVVNYSPTASLGCGTVICSPASGSFFPTGTTTVTCTTTAGPSCSFTVTVNDTQPPMITCPANQVRVTTQPGGLTAVVNYPAALVTDNCAGATVVCSPPSAATFNLGVTTVTCTATDTALNTATCSFTVSVFNACLQDDGNPTTVLLFNTLTGDYRFCCNGAVFTGKGSVAKQGNIWTLTHNQADRRVLARLDVGTKLGTASLQSPLGIVKCSISDRNISNNSCACP
ncbi:MAG: HYR domain-containing protein [Acidobacteria bacterium]|nr:HYR domain-containing protein [Acidobacteriota bacterium]